MSSVPKLTLVLGGARSGKSRYAESLIATLPPPWLYVATAEAGDEEMKARISAHRARRSPDWRTIEAPRHLVAALQKAGTMPVLVDCVTLWLSNLMLAGIDIEAETAHLERALAAAAAPPTKWVPALCRNIRSAGSFAIFRAYSTSESPRAPIASC
jgi:adenosyl cobinamide kinase/adenosyl cobinamide phosphate guanylyltransferase